MSKPNKMILTQHDQKIVDGKWSKVPVQMEVNVMAIVDGYAMVRRPGKLPFVARANELEAPK